MATGERTKPRKTWAHRNQQGSPPPGRGDNLKKALSSRGCPKVVLSQRPEKTPLNINAHPGRSNDAIRPSSTGENRHKAQSPRGVRDTLTSPSGRRFKTPDLPSAARQRPSQTSPSTLSKAPHGGVSGIRRSPASGRGVFCNSATRGSRRALGTWSCAPPCSARLFPLRSSVRRPRVRTNLQRNLGKPARRAVQQKKTRVVFPSVGR